MARRGDKAPKLSPEEEAAQLTYLRIKREQKARVVLQTEAQAVARKLGGLAIDKVADEAVTLVKKDLKNFGTATNEGVIAITLNAVLNSASVPSAPTDDGKGKGKKGGYAGQSGRGGGGKKATAPKIGAKVELLPPPTGAAAVVAIAQNMKTLDKICKVKDGQIALLRALEAYIVHEHNEPVLGDAAMLLKALTDEGLLEKEVQLEYWANVQSTRAEDGVEILALQTQRSEAEAEHKAASNQLKVAKDEEADATQRAKWAAQEVLNARCGNQPTNDEVVREKAANVSDQKCRALKLQRQKDVEMCHKRQVASLTAQEAADRSLVEKTNQMKPFELMNTHTRSFFDSLVANGKAAGADSGEAAAADKKADAPEAGAADKGEN